MRLEQIQIRLCAKYGTSIVSKLCGVDLDIPAVSFLRSFLADSHYIVFPNEAHAGL